MKTQTPDQRCEQAPAENTKEEKNPENNCQT